MVPLFGTPKQTPLKNREKDGALALGGRHSRMTHNNQLINEELVAAVGGMLEMRHVGVRVCVGTLFHLFGQK